METFDKTLGQDSSIPEELPPLTARFDELSRKYAGLMEFLSASPDVELRRTDVMDNKLYVKGAVANSAALDEAWRLVEQVDPSKSEVYLELVRDPEQPGGQFGGTMHTVKEGESLVTISKQYYGTPNEYDRIHGANLELITDPQTPPVGAEIIIPPR